MADPSGASATDLPRHLGLLDSTSIFVGVILGSGIFAAPAAVAAATSSPLKGVALWIACGAVAACGALCYAECGARLPRTGGFYVFYRKVYGEAVAFVGGWAALLVTYPASIAAIAWIFARYLGELLPVPVPNVALAAAAILTSGLLNVVGVRAGAKAQVLLTTAKVGALALVCIAATIGRGTGAAEIGSTPAPLPSSFATLFTAVVILLWTYDGWSDITLVAGEVKDPARNLPRTALLGIGGLVVLYAAVQLAVAKLLPAGAAATSMSVVSDAAKAGLGPKGGTIVGLLVVLATFGAIHGVILTASRLGYAMARDGVFLSWFGSVHPTFGTPARSATALLVASLGYLLAADFDKLLSYFSFSVWIFYGLAATAVLLLRRAGIGDEAGFRAPFGPLAPIVVLTTAVVVTGSVAAQAPTRALVGASLLLAGFPVYFVWQRLRKSAQA